MENLSPKAQAGIVIGLLVVAYLLGYFMLFKKWNQQIEFTKAQIAKVESDIQKGRALQMKINEFNRQINELKERLVKLREILPSRSEAGKFYSNLNFLANENKVYIQSIKAARKVVTDVYIELPYSLELKAGYHDVGKFFASLANFPKIINVKNLSMTKIKNEKQRYSVAVSCTASTYIYNEQADMAQNTGAGAGTGGAK